MARSGSEPKLKKRQAILSRLYFMCRGLLREFRGTLFVLVVVTFSAELLNITMPVITTELICVFGQEEMDNEGFFSRFVPGDGIGMAIFFASAGFLCVTLDCLHGVFYSNTEAVWGMRLKQLVHDKTLAMDATYHDTHKNADCLTNIDGADTVTTTVFTFLMLPVRLLTVCIGLNYLRITMTEAHIPLWLTLLLLPVLAIQPFFAILLGKRLKEVSTRLREAYRNVNDEMFNSLRAPLDVHLMNAHAQRSAAFARVLNAHVRAKFSVNILRALEGGGPAACTTAFQAIIVFVAVISFSNGDSQETAASLVGCFWLMPMIFSRISRIISYYTIIRQSEPEVCALYDLMCTKAAVRTPENPISLYLASPPEILVRKVHFGYAEGVPVLRGVNAHIHAGRTLAIVSRSGAGKSTLLHLLSRLYDPWSGVVLLNNTDLRSFTLSELHTRIAYIPQFPLFISGTLRENFRLMTPETSDADMIDACRKTGIYPILQQNNPNDPLGSIVTVGGENFSGGQRRLLATTRALLRRPWLMLFDEPTTGIDAQSVRNVIQPLFDRLKTEATIALVDHNMNFVRYNADYVLTIEKGAVLVIQHVVP